jgi:cytoskeleton protein RodZ
MTREQRPPSRPETFGAEFRRLREEAGLSPDDLVAETKVSLRIVEALESGRFQFLPERVFSRNFVRQFARILECDEGDLLERFDEAWEAYLLASGSHPAVLRAEPPPSTPVRWGFWLPVAAAALVVVAVGAIVLRQPPTSTDDFGPGRLTSSPSRGAETNPATRTLPTGQPAPTAAVATRPPATPAHDEAASNMVHLAVQVHDGKECWIHYRDRDGRTEQRLLTGDDDLALSLMGPVLLTLGNAGVVQLSVGGEVYSDLGLPGQVVHTEVGPDGVTVLGSGGRHEQ